jgi:acyl-CoA thioester hydrolase
MIDAPFQRYCTEVIPEWVDYNGHMNVAYYVLAFDRGTDVLFDVLGIGADYVRTANHSMFALEGHIAYERELRLGEPLAVRSTILAADAKRLHVFHEMFHGREGWRSATFETMSLHVDMARRRSAPFPDDVQRVLAAAAARHAVLPRPEGIGRRIAMPA